MSLEGRNVTGKPSAIVKQRNNTTHARGGQLMRKQRFAIGLALGIALAAAGSNVEAKDKPFHTSFAGTITNKDDFSFTGTPGGSTYITIAGKSPLGMYTAQGVDEI